MGDEREMELAGSITPVRPGSVDARVPGVDKGREGGYCHYDWPGGNYDIRESEMGSTAPSSTLEHAYP